VGIVCLTKENLDAPWILFEAGAIAKVTGSRLCPFLLDIKKTDVPPPLGEFQATSFDKADVLDLLLTVNMKVEESGETALTIEDLKEDFELRWPKLEQELKAVASKQTAGQAVRRGERELLEEALEAIRGLSAQTAELSKLVSHANSRFAADLFGQHGERESKFFSYVPPREYSLASKKRLLSKLLGEFKEEDIATLSAQLDIDEGTIRREFELVRTNRAIQKALEDQARKSESKPGSVQTAGAGGNDGGNDK
jgi:hypothetical protein